MTSKFVGSLMAIVIAACVITAIIVYPTLPLHALSHWNAAGQGNGALARIWAVTILPAIMLLLFGIWAWLPRLDPIAPGFSKFRRVYDFFFFMIIALLAYIYALSLGANLGWQFNFTKALVPALALFIIIAGTLMPYLHRNWFVGIRTPWTISSDTVWNKTHEFGGRLFQIAGILIAVSSFTSPGVAVAFIVWPLVAAVIASVVYSYLAYKRERA